MWASCCGHGFFSCSHVLIEPDESTRVMCSGCFSCLGPFDPYIPNVELGSGQIAITIVDLSCNI